MCLIFICLNSHPDYPVIIAANRDEFFARPTDNADYWNQYPQLLAGKDMQAGGTWLGMTRTGRFAAITNYRSSETHACNKSRGDIVRDFLSGSDSNENYKEKLNRQFTDYAGYNCIFGQLSLKPTLHYVANHNKCSRKLSPGIHGLSNASLNTPWFKVTEGKKAIQALLEQPFNEEKWLAMLYNKQQAAPEKLPNTGIDKDTEQLLSSRFIQSDNYGTRSSTLITVSSTGKTKFIERNFALNGRIDNTRLFQFQLPID